MAKWIMDRQGRKKDQFTTYNGSDLDKLMNLDQLKRDVKEGKIKPLTAAMVKKLYTKIETLEDTLNTQQKNARITNAEQAQGIEQLTTRTTERSNQLAQKTEQIGTQLRDQKKALDYLSGISVRIDDQHNDQVEVEAKLIQLSDRVDHLDDLETQAKKVLIQINKKFDKLDNRRAGMGESEHLAMVLHKNSVHGRSAHNADLSLHASKLKF